MQVPRRIQVQRIRAGARAVALVEEIAPGIAEAVDLEPELDGEAVALIDRRALGDLHRLQAVEEDAAAELSLGPTRVEAARGPERDGRDVVGDALDIEAIRARGGDVAPALHGQQVGAGRGQRLHVDVGGGEGVEDLVAVGCKEPPVGVAAERLVVEEEALAGGDVEAEQMGLAAAGELAADRRAGRDRDRGRRVEQAERVGHDIVTGGIEGQGVVTGDEIEQGEAIGSVTAPQVPSGDDGAGGPGKRPEHLRVGQGVEVQARALRERERIVIDLAGEIDAAGDRAGHAPDAVHHRAVRRRRSAVGRGGAGGLVEAQIDREARFGSRKRRVLRRGDLGGGARDTPDADIVHGAFEGLLARLGVAADAERTRSRDERRGR